VHPRPFDRHQTRLDQVRSNVAARLRRCLRAKYPPQLPGFLFRNLCRGNLSGSPLSTARFWIARVILRNARAIGSFDFVNATF